MIGFRQPERDAPRPFETATDEFPFLLLSPERFEHGDEGKISDDGMLVLQIVMETKAALREAITDDSHPQVRAVLPAVSLRSRKTPVTRLVCSLPGLAQQFLP